MNKKVTVLLFFLSTTLCVNIKICSQFILITNLYNETVQKRIDEYKYCLQRNLEHPLIDRIHVLYDTSSDNKKSYSKIHNFLKELRNEKLTITKIDKRQTYTDNFIITNNCYPNTNIIIANADIFFDSSLELVTTVSLENTFLCLTRWDVTSKGKLKFFTDEYNMPAIYSQDVWIFKSPIKIPSIDIQVGTLGCDNRIAYEMLKLGYDIYNPCIDIRCCHLHLSAIRNYELSPPKYKNIIYVPWCLSTDLQT